MREFFWVGGSKLNKDTGIENVPFFLALKDNLNQPKRVICNKSTFLTINREKQSLSNL